MADELRTLAKKLRDWVSDEMGRWNSVKWQTAWDVATALELMNQQEDKPTSIAPETLEALAKEMDRQRSISTKATPYKNSDIPLRHAASEILAYEAAKKLEGRG